MFGGCDYTVKRMPFVSFISDFQLGALTCRLAAGFDMDVSKCLPEFHCHHTVVSVFIDSQAVFFCLLICGCILHKFIHQLSPALILRGKYFIFVAEV